VFILNTCSFLH